jgi:hypothetical protein
MEEFLGFLVIVVLFIGALWGILSVAESSNHDQCHDKGKLIQKQVTYREWDGCYVNENGLWIPFDTWTYNRDHGIVMK